jgi:hypothetical protein
LRPRTLHNGEAAVGAMNRAGYKAGAPSIMLYLELE